MSTTLLAQVGEMARRSILQTLRQPAMVIPPVIFPLVLMSINVGGLDAATNLPGFPADTYLDFAIAVPFIQGSLFAALNAGTAMARDVETGFIKRLAMTPMQRAALLIGQLGGVLVVGAGLGVHLPGRRLRRPGWTSPPARPGSRCCWCSRCWSRSAFAAIGRVHRPAHRHRRGGPGLLPAAVRARSSSPRWRSRGR